MHDLISRQVAINEFDGTKVDEEYCTEYDIGYNDGIDFAVSKLSVLPSAQPERMRGKWIYGEDEYGIDGYHCNQCGFFVLWDYAHTFINYIEDYKYCPNCGADMRGEADED